MKNLRLYRARAGLTQKDMSFKIGTSLNMITLLEKPDYISITKEKLEKIAEVLGCDVFELIGMENLKFRPQTDYQKILFIKTIVATLEDETDRKVLWDLLKTLEK